MQFSRLFVLSMFLLLSSEQKLIMATKNISILSEAFEKIIDRFHEQNGQVDVTNFGLDTHIIDFLVIKNLKDKNMIFTLNQEEMSSSYKSYKQEGNGILFFDSIKSLQHFNDIVELTNIFPKSLQFYVFCENNSFSEIDSLREADILKREKRRGSYTSPNEMTDILQFQYFITEDEDVIKLLTFVWYTPENCNEPQLTEVNSFEKKTRRWKNCNFSLNKFENFRGCSLVFDFYRDLIFLNGNVITEANDFNYFGYEIKLFEQLQNHLNFTSIVNPYQSGTDQYFKMNLSFDYKVLESCYNTYVEENSLSYATFLTRPYTFSRNLMAVPPGEEYSGYEKLLMPFDKHTWSLIFAVFIIAFSAIFILTITSASMKQFVFGKNVKTPSLNVAMIFFGITIRNMPRKNFARFITLLFIIYSLIIRTAWQGKMFQFLQKNITKREIQSIHEMIEKNFTFYMNEGFTMWYNDSDLVKR